MRKVGKGFRKIERERQIKEEHRIKKKPEVCDNDCGGEKSWQEPHPQVFPEKRRGKELILLGHK